MRFTAPCVWAIIFLTASVAVAQEWDLGVSGGFGFTRNLTVVSPAGDGKAGFKYGVAAGASVTQDRWDSFGGELRYLYRVSDLKVEGGGQVAGFSGESHSVHYDMLWYSAPRGSRVRLFVAGGAGVRLFRGTGVEHAYQPANKFAWLTKTQEAKPLINAAAGVKVTLGRRMILRLEIRDYVTPFPREVVAPAQGATIKGWLHDFVPAVGLSWRL